MKTSREQFDEWWNGTERGLIIINADVQKDLYWHAWQASRQCIEPFLPDDIEARLIALPIMDEDEASELINDIHSCLFVKGA